MQLKCDIWGFVCVSITMFSTVLYAQMHHLKLYSCSLSVCHTTDVSLHQWLSLSSYGEASRGSEAAARKAMSDQPGAAEAKQRPG